MLFTAATIDQHGKKGIGITACVLAPSQRMSIERNPAAGPTFMLSHWHREKGTFSLAETIRLLTSAPARILGFDDRGTLAAGMRADVNVIDIDRVAEAQPKLVNDFPRWGQAG